MSKLDGIRVEFAEFTVSLDSKAKQQIKDLMLELIGEDDMPSQYLDQHMQEKAEWFNERNAELRRKVAEL